MAKTKFAIIDTWPWGVKNAESEVINRMKVATENIGAELVCITKEGFIVDDDFQQTGEKIDASTLDFVLSMHYEDVKMQDAFHYHTLWNPPKITLQYPLYHLYSKNIASHDDYLIYDDGGMSDHLKTLLSDHPRDLTEASSLTASFSKTAAIPPEIPEMPVLFYCGMNWERFIGAEARHAGLFGLLDKQKDVNFYGPKHSWDGYKRYKGSIPFDGISLIEEIHKCGVVLALSSDYHYCAGAATNRIYEACAGGAITISDTNRFIMKHFGDSVLYIDFDKKDSAKMFDQIRKHLDWIKVHPDEALEKAKRAQKIFLEKFSLEKQLGDIIDNHQRRKEKVAEALYAKNKGAKTLAILFLDKDKLTDNETTILANEIKNIESQKDTNVTLVICCDMRTEKEVSEYVKHSSADIRVLPVQFFDDFSNKELTRGQVFKRAAALFPHDYLMLLDSSETMFSTHVTTLIRTLEDNAEAVAAYSGDFLDTPDGMRSLLLREPIYQSDFYNGNYPNFYPHPAGMFLFRAEVETFLPVEAERYLDDCLPNALLNLAIFNYHRKVKYSQSMTVGKIQHIDIDFPKVMATPLEINFVQGLVQTGYEEWRASFPEVSSSKNMTFSKADAHMFKVFRRWFRKKLLTEIILNYCRFPVTFRKNKREKIRAKIDKLKQEYRQTRSKICI